MKNPQPYFSLLIFLTLSMNSFGQLPPESELGYTDTKTRSNDSVHSDELDSEAYLYMMYNKHTEMAKHQIINFVSEEMQYPEDEHIEGKVYFQLDLDASGAVVDIVIIKGLRPRFDKAVLGAMKELKSIELSDEKEYLGQAKITIPIYFSSY